MSLRGKRCLVTGANRGIGLEIAARLAGLGADLVVLCRTERSAAEAAAAVRARTGVAAAAVHAEFADLEQVRAAAAEILRRCDRLDVVVHNAGLLSPRRRLSRDGFELTVAVNHLAPFLLNRLLLPRILESAPARVVTVASSAHRRPRDLDDLESERGYRMMLAYGRSKLANLAFAFELARRLEGTGVTSNAVHPGFVDTGLTRTGFDALVKLGFLYPIVARLFRSPEKGAGTPVYLASSPEVEGVTGKYFVDERPVAPAAPAADPALWAGLWRRSEEMVGTFLAGMGSPVSGGGRSGADGGGDKASQP